MVSGRIVYNLVHVLKGGRYDYSELFNTANARYRSFMLLLMAFFGVRSSIMCSDKEANFLGSTAMVGEWFGVGFSDTRCP